MSWSDIRIPELKVDELRNELEKQGMNSNKMKNQDLCDTIQKYVEDKVPNVTNDEMYRKALSGFLNTAKR